ncbi:hypothetical protein [Mycolicibacterium fortuitum]|uniref:hypothetical protein n=1 Tax=Mycolicibacterium fortuitum TaxID=1766 RepID=UPI00149084D0|nr:hypothetical protein [Mycolicibacterium fortuitum]
MSEDETDPGLPAWVEAYFESERTWWRLLRGTGAISEEQARAELWRWMADER